LQLTAKTVTLRDIQLNDLDTIQHWLHPDHYWHQLDGPYYPATPAEKIPELIERQRTRLTTGNYPDPRTRLAIVNQSDVIMGMVTRYWISEETNWAAIGLAIWDADHWGQGYGYQALGLWCQYLFDNMPEFVRLDARTWSGNKGMMRLAEKLGFTQEAVFRKARIVDGTYYDGIGYGILRDEWQARYPQGFANHLS